MLHVRRLYFIGCVLVLLLLTMGSFAQEDVVPRGEHLLGIDVSTAEGEEYDEAFLLALDLGMNEIGLSLDWADLETAPGVYDDSVLSIANIYYPAFEMPISLTLRPIHTGTLRVPDDLQNVTFDDAQMIERFNALLDFVFEAMPDVTFSSLVIGSEFDDYLGADAAAWEAYTVFAQATAAHARELRPGLQVSFEAMVNGYSGEAAPYLENLNQYADVIGVSYYPIGDDFQVQSPENIHEVFALLAETYPDQPIYFYQYGYPSSELLGSSEELQAQFIRETFVAWDQYADQVQMIDFTWLTEQSPETVDSFEEYYGFSSETFAAFLGSLGLRIYDGSPKLALDVLREEAEKRGW